MRDYPGIPNRRLPPGHSMSPTSTPQARMWEAAKRWSPAGITAAFLIFFFAIGGHDGVAKLAAAVTGAQDLKTEIKALRADIKVEREERAKVMARMYATENNLSALCDFVSSINGGRPNRRWCSKDGRAISINTVQSPPPMRSADYEWIYVE